MKKNLIFAALALGLFACSRAPMREQPADRSSPVTNSPPIDLNAAIARAKAENKIVLLDFTGSDWCPPCMELQKKVFSKPEFESYAKSNLIFLEVNFPAKYHLPADAAATNDLLSTQFNIQGFPTLIALDGNGKHIWKQLGMIDGGAKELISELESAVKKSH